MKINQMRFNALKKVIEAGYTDENKIAKLSTEELLKFCKSIQEMSAIVALQKAIADKKLIAFLAESESGKNGGVAK